MIVEGGVQKWSVYFYRRSVRGTWRCKRRLWRWALLSMEALLGNLGEGSYAEGFCVEGSETGVHIGAPLGDLGRGVHLPGTLRNG